jgi:hypothetical protein
LFGDTAKETRASSDGLLLLTEATDTTAQGVIFGLGLQNAEGMRTYSYSLVSLKVE